jgi:predicted nucleic acid-binding protein
LIFLDTSVLVATTLASHQHHASSLRLWKEIEGQPTAISAHTLAELYNVLTILPLPLRVSPRDAVVVVETFLMRLKPVSLLAEEYLETMRNAANLGQSGGGGMIYDALHIACARKIKAERIYTWNVRHFRSLAVDLSERIASP